jgi:hypothetical protein
MGSGTRARLRSFKAYLVQGQGLLGSLGQALIKGSDQMEEEVTPANGLEETSEEEETSKGPELSLERSQAVLST